MDLLKLVKSMLNISETDTSNDEYLNNLIAFATSFFTNITGQVLTENTEIEEKYNNENNSERYTTEDSYNDGGGGDEWSDPSEFW